METATTRVLGPMNLSRSSGKQATTSSVAYSRSRDFSSTRTPAGMYLAEPSSFRSTSRQLGYLLFRTNSSHLGREANAIWMK